jgi:hypothetical protein
MTQSAALLKKCDDILIDIAGTDGDVFIPIELDDFIDMSADERKTLDLGALETIYQRLRCVQDEYAFATVLKTIVIMFVGLVDRYRQKSSAQIGSDFYSRNKNFIDQLWYWIVYYNLWYTIQFIVNILMIIKL